MLVVDDDQDTREAIADALAADGFHPIAASDGGAAWELLATLPYRPSVIVLDLMMPVMNGWELLDRVRGDARYRAIPIIVCSAFPESSRTVPADAVLPKPFSQDRLTSTMQALV